MRIKQILYNLLSNAIKFTGEGKRISIDTCAVDSDVTILVQEAVLPSHYPAPGASTEVI